MYIKYGVLSKMNVTSIIIDDSCLYASLKINRNYTEKYLFNILFDNLFFYFKYNQTSKNGEFNFVLLMNDLVGLNDKYELYTDLQKHLKIIVPILKNIFPNFHTIDVNYRDKYNVINKLTGNYGRSIYVCHNNYDVIGCNKIPVILIKHRPFMRSDLLRGMNDALDYKEINNEMYESYIMISKKIIIGDLIKKSLPNLDPMKIKNNILGIDIKYDHMINNIMMYFKSDIVGTIDVLDGTRISKKLLSVFGQPDHSMISDILYRDGYEVLMYKYEKNKTVMNGFKHYVGSKTLSDTYDDLYSIHVRDINSRIRDHKTLYSILQEQMFDFDKWLQSNSVTLSHIQSI